MSAEDVCVGIVVATSETEAWAELMCVKFTYKIANRINSHIMIIYRLICRQNSSFRFGNLRRSASGYLDNRIHHTLIPKIFRFRKAGSLGTSPYSPTIAAISV